jgi:hypothetical protein
MIPRKQVRLNTLMTLELEIGKVDLCRNPACCGGFVVALPSLQSLFPSQS